jgi:signal peptidase II
MGSVRQTLRSPAAWSRFAGVALGGLVLDLATKHLAAAHLDKPGAVIRLVPDVLHFVYTENLGAVFGLGQGMRPMFLAVSALAVGILGWLFATSGRHRVYQVVLGMLLAGVIGNMYDRIVYGHVRDMIYALPGWYWPQWVVHLIPYPWRDGATQLAVFPWIFNVADSLLCVGVTLMIAMSLLGRAPAKAADETSVEAQPQGPAAH